MRLNGFPFKAINPAGARYTIPAGTEGIVSQIGCDGWRVHTTKTDLEFDYAYSFHGPDTPVFQVDREWMSSVPIDRIAIHDHRVINALLFTLEGSGSQQLIAWPDEYGRSQYARPKRHSDTLLDVRAYQEILHAGDRGEQELVITQVQLYRCNRHSDNGLAIDCGRAWLDSSGAPL